jgi:hypothetical protein
MKRRAPGFFPEPENNLNNLNDLIRNHVTKFFLTSFGELENPNDDRANERRRRIEACSNDPGVIEAVTTYFTSPSQETKNNMEQEIANAVLGCQIDDTEPEALPVFS